METNSLMKGLLTQQAPVRGPRWGRGCRSAGHGACTSGEHVFVPRGSGCRQAQAVTHTGDPRLCRQRVLVTCILRGTRRRKDTVRFCPVVTEIKQERCLEKKGVTSAALGKGGALLQGLLGAPLQFHWLTWTDGLRRQEGHPFSRQCQENLLRSDSHGGCCMLNTGLVRW